jgi:prephenate dehydrogenase
MIHRLGVVGVGLLGGSFALATRARHPVNAIIGFDPDAEALARAAELGLIDRPAASLAELAQACDLILVAAPVGAVPAIFATLATHVNRSTWIMDVGSTKQSVLAAARAHLGTVAARFVPAHPIAGGERSGPDAASRDLFQNRHVILSRSETEDAGLYALAWQLWEQLGARPLDMTSVEHDRVFAAVSHLPHFASFAMVGDYAQRADGPLLFAHAGGGFRDFARIAGSSPSMWRDIALHNREALLAEMDRYLAALTVMRQQIANADSAALTSTLHSARDMRARWLAGEFAPRDTLPAQPD